MKERRNIRYISGRIWWMGMAVLALLVILTVTQAVLFFQGQGPLWNVVSDSSNILDQQTISAGRKDHGAFSGRLYGYGRRWGAGSVADTDDCRRDEVHGAFSAFSADDGSE